MIKLITAEKNTFLVSLLTGHHTEDHGIFADQVFSSVYQDILDIDDANLWNKTRELGTIWVIELCSVKKKIILKYFGIYRI
jgi:hypothetical protein